MSDEATTGATTETAAAETTAATTLVTEGLETKETAGDSTSTETAGGETTAETTEAVAEEAAPGAPEAYADFTLPEGYELDGDVAGEFRDFAKEANLPQDKAQAAVDLAVKLQEKTRQAGETLFEQNDGVISHPQYVEKWIERAKADPEIGGDKLGDTLATAKRALAAYGSPALTELLNKTGFGNHPEFIRAFAKAGKGVSEDSVVTGGGTVATPHRTLAQKIYESSKE